MNTVFFSFMTVLMMLLGQGRGDLLDLIQSADYWKSKGVVMEEAAMLAELKGPGQAPDISKDLQALGSDEYKVRAAARQKIEALGSVVAAQLQKAQAEAKDPEVAAACKDMLGKLARSANTAQVRKLMAICTLGELKAKGAVGALRELAKSEEMFVADYANRSLAQIEGRPWDIKADAARRDRDVWLLPEKCGVVGQMNAAVGSMTGQELSAGLSDATLKRMGMSREEAAGAITGQVIQVAEQVGNVRLEGLTVGVSDEASMQGLWFVIVAQGKFDPEAVGKVIEMMPFEKMTRRMEGKVAVYEPGNSRAEVAFLLDGSERLVMIAAPSPESTKEITDAMLAALKEGKGKLGDSADFAALVKGADRTAPLWAVAKISESYRQGAAVAPFDTISATATIKDGKVSAKIAAKGKDKAKVDAAVELVNTAVKKQLEQFHTDLTAAPAGVPPEMAEQIKESRRQMMESLKPMIEVMESIKAEAEAGGAILAAELKIQTLRESVAQNLSRMVQMRRASTMPAPRPGAMDEDGMQEAPQPRR